MGTIRRMAGDAWIGRSVPRKKKGAKVTGQARYVDDLSLPGMLHGVTVRSPIARGTIRSIHVRRRHPLGRTDHRHGR